MKKGRKVLDPVTCSQGILCRGVTEDHFFLEDGVGQGQLKPGFRFQKDGGDDGGAGVDTGIPVADRRCFPAAVNELQLGHVAQRPGFKQIENRCLAAVKHHQIGFHVMTAHLDPIGRLAGFFLVNGPDHGTVLLGKTVPFKNDLVLDMLFIGNTLEQKTALQVGDQVIASRALEGQEGSAGCRMVGKQVAMQ